MTALARPAARVFGIPAVVLAAIAFAWGLAIAGQAAGDAAALHHDALIHSSLPDVAALGLFLLAWQAMIAAMMLPSSLPLVGLFARASAAQPRPGRAIAAFLGGYAAVWTAFGALAFIGDIGVHFAVDNIGWLARHDRLIAGPRSRSRGRSSSRRSRTPA